MASRNNPESRFRGSDWKQSRGRAFQSRQKISLRGIFTLISVDLERSEQVKWSYPRRLQTGSPTGKLICRWTQISFLSGRRLSLKLRQEEMMTDQAMGNGRRHVGSNL